MGEHDFNEDESKILEYLRQNPSLRVKRGQIYIQIGRETGISVDEGKKAIESLQRKGIVRLSSQSSYDLLERSSEDFIALEVVGACKSIKGNEEKESGEKETENYLKCPYCGNIYSEDNLNRHLKRKHVRAEERRRRRQEQQTNEPYERRELVKCPDCDAEVRKDRLERHKNRAHESLLEPYVPTQSQASTKAEIPLRARELAGEICLFLEKRDYETTRFENYIIATYIHRSTTFMIKIEDSKKCLEYNSLATMVLTPGRFMTLVRQLDRASKAKAIDTSKLQTDVITAFGWHADFDEGIRHSSLELAAEVWGTQHISDLLRMLVYMWAKNPMLEHHAPVAKADCKWFEREVVIGSNPKKKMMMELIEKLEDELSVLGIPRERFENIDRWFILTY